LVRTLGEKLWQIAVGFSVVSAVALTPYAVAPKLIVSPSERLDSANPLSTVFNVTNDGLFTIHSVQLVCGIRNVIAGHTRMTNIALKDSKLDRSHMSPGENAVIGCGNVNLGPQLTTADISIDVSFRPAYWFLRIERHFAFTAHISKDGQVHWLTKDYSE
jgi:hypothetical protein